VKQVLHKSTAKPGIHGLLKFLLQISKINSHCAKFLCYTIILFGRNRKMSLNKEEKIAVVKQYARADKDTGSVEVQVALLTRRINNLRAHFAKHKKDSHSRRGLLRMVNNRRQLLNYLKSKDRNRYQSLISSLGLRR